MMRLWAVFDSWVQDALPALKDRRKMGPGKADAAQMAERVRSRGWGPDGLSPDALWKARETRSQGRDNVDGADPADGRAVKDESVVLMNEVATVGSAILACTPAF